MILKIDNKSKNFYNIMGRFFGSRIVQNKTNDRIYDDNNKIWYVYMDNEIPVAFVSLSSDVIKNVYSIKDKFLIELLTYVKNQIQIQDSIVTAIYSDVYKSCGFFCNDAGYKNFIKIRSVA